jgi:hypothetical protein
VITAAVPGGFHAGLAISSAEGKAKGAGMLQVTLPDRRRLGIFPSSRYLKIEI